jgi:hypothetical protein
MRTLDRLLTLFDRLPDDEQELMILIMHNWHLNGACTVTIQKLNLLLMSHEFHILPDPQHSATAHVLGTVAVNG